MLSVCIRQRKLGERYAKTNLFIREVNDMKRWKGNVTNSAYDAEGKFYLADEAQAEIDKAIELLDAAVCPCCDKSGAYYDNDGGVCQCQWCAEVEALKHKGE